MYIWLVHRLCFFYIKAKCAITFAIILFRKSFFRSPFCFVSSVHVFLLFLYTLRILRAFSRFVLHFSLCFCIIQIRNPEHLIVYLTLSTPQRKNKHSVYNNMKEGDFLMKYGHFDDVHQEYVITTPRLRFPVSTTWAAMSFSV